MCLLCHNCDEILQYNRYCFEFITLNSINVTLHFMSFSGASLNLTNIFGKTPLDIAIVRDYDDVAEVLILAGKRC